MGEAVVGWRKWRCVRVLMLLLLVLVLWVCPPCPCRCCGTSLYGTCSSSSSCTLATGRCREVSISISYDDFLLVVAGENVTEEAAAATGRCREVSISISYEAFLGNNGAATAAGVATATTGSFKCESGRGISHIVFAASYFL